MPTAYLSLPAAALGLVTLIAGAWPAMAAPVDGGPTTTPARPAAARRPFPGTAAPIPRELREGGRGQGAGSPAPAAAKSIGSKNAEDGGSSVSRRGGNPVERRLRDNHVPPSAQELAALGPRVDEALIAVARDEKAEPSVRARAVAAMAHTPTRPARSFLTLLLERQGYTGKPTAAVIPRASSAGGAGGGQSATSVETAVLLLRRAMVAYGWIGGSQATVALAPLLAHPDPDVRADSAVALALTRLPGALAPLRARLPKETDARVRGHMARQLAVLESALLPPPTAPGSPPATR